MLPRLTAPRTPNRRKKKSLREGVSLPGRPPHFPGSSPGITLPHITLPCTHYPATHTFPTHHSLFAPITLASPSPCTHHHATHIYPLHSPLSSSASLFPTSRPATHHPSHALPTLSPTTFPTHNSLRMSPFIRPPRHTSPFPLTHHSLRTHYPCYLPPLQTDTLPSPLTTVPDTLYPPQEPITPRHTILPHTHHPRHDQATQSK